MGAQTFSCVEFAKTAEEAQKEAWDDAEDYYGHHEGYSGQINAKRRGAVKVIDEEDLKNRDRRKVMREILNGEGELGEKYERIQSKMGPTGAISLKGTQEASEYRERNDLKGHHGHVWLLFGWARC